MKRDEGIETIETEPAPNPRQKPNSFDGKERTMFKKTRIELQDLTETKSRIGRREVTEAVLKMVSGGQVSQGGTSSNTADTDQ